MKDINEIFNQLAPAKKVNIEQKSERLIKYQHIIDEMRVLMDGIKYENLIFVPNHSASVVRNIKISISIVWEGDSEGEFFTHFDFRCGTDPSPTEKLITEALNYCLYDNDDFIYENMELFKNIESFAIIMEHFNVRIRNIIDKIKEIARQEDRDYDEVFDEFMENI